MTNAVKILPSSLEAEQGLLASMLLDNNVPMQVFPVIKTEDFFSKAHSIIFDTMRTLYSGAQPVEFITLVNKLESLGKLEAVGGLEYITTLTSLLPSATNFLHYQNIVKNHARRRKLILASQQITQQCFDNENSAEDLAFAEQQIFKISESEQVSDLEHIEPALDAVIDKFDFLAKNGGALRGLPTGLADLDQLLGGLQKSDLIVLAARPGVGKTSLAMNFVNNSAINHGKTCAVFSLEMPKTQIAQRSLCSVGCVSLAKALEGHLTEPEWRKIWKAKKDLGQAKIFIDDNGLNTPNDILSKCRRIKLEHGLDLVMIDYLQLMKSGSNQQNRVLEIGEITRFLKIAAKDLNVPIVLLSQLNRGVDARPDHRPVISDLRDSGTIEQDADIIMFLYNPEKYNDAVVENGKEGLVELEVAKHRNGSPGRVYLRWIGEWTTFTNKDTAVELPRQAPVAPQNIEKEELANTAELDSVFGTSANAEPAPLESAQDPFAAPFDDASFDAPQDDFVPPPQDAPPEDFE